MASAVIGKPPKNEDDYWIVLGIIRLFGLDSDPAKGILVPPIRPLDAKFESRGHSLIISNVACIVLAILFAGSRLLIRALHRGLKWGWDDWFMLLGASLGVAWFSTGIAMVVYGGGGKHTWDLTYREYNWQSKLAVVKTLLYLPTNCMIQISITLFNRRITGLASRVWRVINDVFLGVLACYMVTYTVALATRCRSSNYSVSQLGQMSQTTKCSRKLPKRLVFALIVMQVVLGFCLLVTPIIVLWKVRMDRARKMGPVIIFAIGAIPCVAALMIVITQYQITKDFSWYYMKLETYIQLDLLFGIIVASLPILYGQIPKMWRQVRTYTRSYTHSQTRSQNRSHSQHVPIQSVPDSIVDGNRVKGGKHHHDDLEFNTRIDVDDQIELLKQLPKPHLTPSLESATTLRRDK